MRASILAWSALSGVVMGVLLDAALIGVAMSLVALVPSLADRLNQRWLAIGAAAVLCALPLALAALGYLEGELKAA